MKKKKQGLARLLEIAGQKKHLLILSGILSCISAVCMLVPFASVYHILAELFAHADNTAAIDGRIPIRWGWTALIALIAGLLFMYASLMASHVAAFRILYGLRMKIARHLGTLSLGYLNRNATGAVKKTVEENVEKIEQFVAHTIPDLVQVAATVLVLGAVMFLLSPWPALACLSACILGFGLQASAFFGKEGRKNIKKYYDALERISASAVQYIRGIPAVKIFGHTVSSFRSFNRDIHEYRDFAVRYTDSFQNGYILFKVLMGSFLTFILPAGLLIWDGKPAAALTVLFFIVMAPGAATPLLKLMLLASGTRTITEGVERIDKILEEPSLSEPSEPRMPAEYGIRFQNVSFSYAGREEPAAEKALKQVDFTAEAGKLTALVGPSGSGKSTIANLIPRFWDTAEGKICIGDVDIRDMRTSDLMETVSFVFQDSFLFHDTLYENILAGRPEADEKEVFAAAKAAQCHDFIESLPDGYGTKIGEQGVYLSGGEEQRISVARAILKNAPILVLDEATAFADPENEYKMQLALQKLIRGKTVIVIAHRLSSIREADQILVLEEGRIVQRGRHEQLCAQQGLYRNMWRAYTDASGWSLRKGGGAA